MAAKGPGSVKSAPTSDTPSPERPPADRAARPFSGWPARAVFGVIAVAGLAIGFRFDTLAVPLSIGVLASAAVPWRAAWIAARGTALRPALWWAALGLCILGVAHLLAWSEPPSSGGPLSGRLTYIAVLSFLAAFTSVLNARSPGAKVWAGLMAVLIVVFLIPWLEAPTRLRRSGGLAPLHLDAPWTLFYLVIVLVGVTNYLPTRFGVAAVGFALGFSLEYLGLTGIGWSPERRAAIWSGVGWSFGASVWIARWCAQRAPRARTKLERQWFWFRDAWGVVWALRTLERFNREAQLRNWPVRLGWFGLTAAGSSEPHGALPNPEEAEATLRGLLRRFVEPARLDDL
jgi:hypothetical protein